VHFTVLIEFLVPGLATTLLTLALLPLGAIPQLPTTLPTGEAATALLLLAVSYPVGILTNSPVYKLQSLLLTPWAHRSILEKYQRYGLKLTELASRHIGLIAIAEPQSSRERLRDLFGSIRASVFSKNIARLNANHLYHEGLQRFARGMFIPLALAAILVCRKQLPAWQVLLAALSILFVSALSLLIFSVRTEEEQVVRFFIVLAASSQTPVPSASPSSVTPPSHPGDDPATPVQEHG
jgi:hypothetical protein